MAGTASYISAGRKFIEAKAALKHGSFTHLVEVLLGHDLPSVERWMAIARHPVLSKSATLPNLPTAWTTLYALSQIPEELLLKYIADGAVHARLTYRAAVTLKKDHNPGEDDVADGAARGNNPDDEFGEESTADLDGDLGEDTEDNPGADHHGGKQGSADTVGSDSPGETARLQARLEELERETRQQALQIIGLESENADLKAKLGPEQAIRGQRRLFMQAVRALQKAELPTKVEKEKRSLRQSALTYLIGFVQAAARDGLKPERFDLFYRPEVH